MEGVTPLDSEDACPYVGEALRRLREEVAGQSTVLGFVGAPFTLASYIVEVGSRVIAMHCMRCHAHIPSPGVPPGA